MVHVLDTNVLVGALRSPNGASAEIVRQVFDRRIAIACSVPMFLEYETVLSRPEHLSVTGASLGTVINLLDALATLVQPVEIHFLWRPQLRDAEDDMVLEAAVNGQARSIITFNQRDFLPQASTFGLKVQTPAQFFQGVHHHGNTK
jgi:putative PIN family toxin of toxin-antitoxin system